MRIWLRMLCVVGTVATVLPGVADAGKGTPPPQVAWYFEGDLMMGDAGGRYGMLSPRPGNVFAPAISPDGRYVAFLWQPRASTSMYARPGYLWLSHFCVNVPALPPPHCDAHEIAEIGPVSAFRWSPTADRLVVRTGSGSNLLVDWNGVMAHLPSGGTGLPAWSPDGRSIAMAANSGHGHSRLVLFTSHGTMFLVLRGLARYAVPILAGWWDAHHLLYWIDPYGSGSIAADGMQLVDLDLHTGSVRHLGVMLGYHNWLAIHGRRLLMVAGGGRSAFFGKHVQLCTLHGLCRAIAGIPAGDIAIDPTWSPDGRHVAFVVAPAWHTYGFISGARYHGWLAAHALWIANGDGSNAHPLVLHCRGLQCAGDSRHGALHGELQGAADPVWTPGGLIFERDGGLWFVRSLSAFNAQPVAVLTRSLVPNLEQPVYQDWYYGHMDWHELFDAR